MNERIEEISINDRGYPEDIRRVVEPPRVLYVRGKMLPEDARAVTIVGARKCTSYGKQVAYDFAFALAKQGITVVSGMALGIDGEAHKGALDAGGRTIAVLGTGVDDASLYPDTHAPLAKRIIKQGAVISEFSSGTPALPHHFPQRNRIVAALGLGTLVVEADEKSGSLITAGFALELGKDVFAVPGSIYSRTSTGTHKLIQQGAKLVTKVEDILEALQLAPTPPVQGNAAENERERLVLSLVAEEPLEIDTIIERLDLPSNDVLSLLAILELKQKVTRIGGNSYAIKK